MRACFTGHRPQDLGGFDESAPMNVWVKEALDDAVFWAQGHGVTEFISGMALGVDQWGAKSALWAGANVIAAVPCDGQDSMWPTSSRQEYRRILDQCARVHVVSPGPYAAWKMQRRNEWMVNESGLVIAVWSGKAIGGTANCVRYARERRKAMYHINPVTRQVTLPGGL